MVWLLWWREEVGVRRTEAMGRGVMVEEVSEVRGGLVVEGFESEEQDFELDAVRDREPVEILKDRGDMLT